MHYCRPLLILLSQLVSVVVADYLTGAYPPPLDLTSSHSLVAASWQELSSLFDATLDQDNRNGSEILANDSGLENLTFSLGMFSLHDPGAVNLQYHHTGQEVASGKNGTKKVDADSIYMIASVSTLVTTYVGMLRLSPDDWNRPLTEVSPEFEKYFSGTSNPIWNTQWDKVTLWSLATQLSGLPTLGLPATTSPGDFYNPNETAFYGAPHVNLSAWSAWVASFSSTTDYISLTDAIATIANIPPNFQPWTTPAYSDLNFMLLGTLMSNMTNKSLPALYHDTVFAPLGMTSSSFAAPTDLASIARAVLPLDPFTGFTTEPAFYTPSGGILSTIHDLQSLGIGILNHTLLSTEATRKWMKPVSHTASLSDSVGAPWEIHRYIHPNTTKVTDLYTKVGSSGSWGGVLVLIPQYDAGFAMLNSYTGTSRDTTADILLDYVVNHILPGLDAQAAAEAKLNFVGTYTSDSLPDTLVTIGYNETAGRGSNSPLVVTNWHYNGTDVLKGPFFNASTAPLHLEPSIPNQIVGQPGQVAFQAARAVNYLTYADAMKVPGSKVYGPFTGMGRANGDFAIIDYVRWGGVGVDLFVFDVDADGKATALTPAVDRIKLKRV